MFKEPSVLTTARAALKRAEEDPGDPGRLVHFRNAIHSLCGVMSGHSPQIEKDIAKKLVLSYRSKVLSEIKSFLADGDSFDAESLEHWITVMGVFVLADEVNDPEFSAYQDQLLERRSSQFIGSFSAADLAVMEKELQAALDNLSAHRSRFSSIKWGIRR